MLWPLSNPYPTQRTLLASYRGAYIACVEDGTLRPPVLPYQLFGLTLLITYLMIPHQQRPWLYTARWVVLAAIVAFETKVIMEASSMDMAVAFGSGLIASWTCVWSATWLIWNRPQFEAKRLERRKKVQGEVDGEGQTVGAVIEEGREFTAVQNGKIRQRKGANGHTVAAEKVTNEVEKLEEWEYYWQSYPLNSLATRLSWVIDLLLNFRGPGWNWCIFSSPSLPPEIKASLREPVDAESQYPCKSVSVQFFSSRRALIRAHLPRFIVGYMLLDIAKIIIMEDAYFLLGPNPYPAPAWLSGLSPLQLTLFRRAFALVALVTALEMVFLLPALFLCLIFGTRCFGIRGESWMYLTTWGSFSSIFEKGLAGFWGSWWHQTFRFAFAAPTQYLISCQILDPRSKVTKIVGVVFAFAISGFLHASGSTSLFPATKPWNPPFFFMLQAVGITLQTLFCSSFKRAILHFPRSFRKVGNLVWTFGWLYLTCDLLLDDFARGGLWMYEPIPVSPLRALGFGTEGAWWYCWENVGVSWYHANWWWESGIAF